MRRERPHSATPPIVLRDVDAGAYLARTITKPAFVLLVLVVATIIQMLRYGANPHYLLLLGGSVTAGLLMFGFAVLVDFDQGAKRRGLIPALVAFGGFVPYAFGCYLVFYEGFWRLANLLRSFSIWGVVVSILFVIGGFTLVNGMYRLSTFARQGDDGEIVVQ